MGGDTVQCCYRESLRYTLYSVLHEPKLYRLAVSGQWDRIPDRCANYPKEASFVHKYPPSDTALHRILEVVLTDDEKEEDEENLHTLKRNAARAVFHAYPAALAVANAFGRTPLHLACMDPHPSSAELAVDFVSSYPRAAAGTDVEQRTPLHHWCSILHKMIPNVETVEKVIILLLEQNPDTVNAKDMAGETPIDIAQRRSKGQCPDRILTLLQHTNYNKY